MPPKKSQHKVPVTLPAKKIPKGKRADCPYCKTEQSAANMARHKRTCKANPDRNPTKYKCTEEGCDKGFPSQDKLTHHRDRHHSDEKKYGCDICHKHYWTRPYLRSHMKWAHTSARPYICYCSADFKTKDALDRHAAIHDPSVWVRCPFDLRVVGQAGNFPAHLKVHSCHDPEAHSELVSAYRGDTLLKPEEVTALILGMGYSNADVLSYPSRYRTIKRKPRGMGANKCNKCPRAYSANSDLASHKTTQHNQVDKYTCAYCLHNPTLTYKFKRHFKVHSSRDPKAWKILCNQFDSGELPKHQKTTASILEVGYTKADVVSYPSHYRKVQRVDRKERNRRRNMII